MTDERQETLDFLTRMATKVSETRKMEAVMVEQADLARLVKMGCLAEKDKDDRQQRYFERLCESGATFYEA